jgi:hypothetical protein
MAFAVSVHAITFLGSAVLDGSEGGIFIRLLIYNAWQACNKKARTSRAFSR